MKQKTGREAGTLQLGQYIDFLEPCIEFLLVNVLRICLIPWLISVKAASRFRQSVTGFASFGKHLSVLNGASSQFIGRKIIGTTTASFAS
ncbi:hypothetical protein KDH_79780 [Dictyobacter sp. S3.2.2.5]|uniref:Uncharacterized protein n=1 Tax=Dictyobacter halimunensis TaxID=3026934 RepID=A0ABQ6G3S0_9CHLR|nr:hypothetical protein KDH_79780 [Dictyobacter sp. S3.2.2.5]